MVFEFRLVDSIVVLVLILCIVPDKTASRQANRESFRSVQSIMPFLSKKDRPMFHNRVLNRSLTSQFSAAQYMLNLYKSLGTVDDDNSQSFNISNVTSTKQVQGVDTIMGILNDATDNTTNSCNFCLRLKFNFTAKIQSNDSVKAAEFHIYKDAPKYAWMQNASFVVELSMITKAGNFIKLRKQLARRVILGGKIGWEVFDVTSPVDVWRIPANNYGLEVSVTFPRQGFPIPVDPGTFGLVGFTGPYGQRPFIVSFFKGDPTEGELVVQASNRKRRSSFSPRKLKYANKASSTECKMRHFYVDFQEIGWSKWIVHPKGYELNYCAGECSFPLSVSHNATNHATVQVLVSLLNPDSAPPPCCAPTKLKPISVLYFDDRQNIVLKKYHDMIVASCGCL